MKRVVMSLAVIQKGGKVLLGMKKKGMGTGHMNGYGGKLEPEESMEECVRREVREEAGIELGAIEKGGVIEFEITSIPDTVFEVHAFRSSEYTGEPVETEEMAPHWFAESDIPYENMWPGDRYWMPLLLAGKHFTGRFVFGEGDTVIAHQLNETEIV